MGLACTWDGGNSGQTFTWITERQIYIKIDLREIGNENGETNEAAKD
jgi:hypothetical protein